MNRNPFSRPTNVLQSILAVCAILIAQPDIAPGAEHFVPQDFPTIHDALLAAADGDVVTVAPGEYEIRRSIHFNWNRDPWDPDAPPPKNLVLRSAEGPERTVIRKTGSGPVAFFEHGEGPESKLEGFTLTGGGGWNAVGPRNTADVVPDEFYGGGVCITNSSPVIEDCIVRGNGFFDQDRWGESFGGGVACIGATAAPRFVRCQIIENAAGYGGGLLCAQGSPTFVDCTIAGNRAYTGGGMYCADWPIEETWFVLTWRKMESPPLPADTPPARFLGCRIADNRAKEHHSIPSWYRGEGGGVTFSVTSHPAPETRWEFTECLIANNSAGMLGSAIYTDLPYEVVVSMETIDDGGRVAVFDRCMIQDNRTSSETRQPMGAIYLYRSDLRHCLVIGNQGAQETIGMIASRLTNCTIARNPAGGVHDYGSETLSEMHNSIVWGNGGPNDLAARVVDGVSNLTFNCIEGEDLPAGEGNIKVDPRLDREGRLLPGSPCIDAGDNQAVPADAFDAAGGWRFWDEPDATDTGRGAGPLVDMGAFEYRLLEMTGVRRLEDTTMEVEFVADPPAPGHAYRLLQSLDLGASWTITPGLEARELGNRRHSFRTPKLEGVPRTFYRITEQRLPSAP